jgi:hypothetical protein
MIFKDYSFSTNYDSVGYLGCQTRLPGTIMEEDNPGSKINNNGSQRPTDGKR